MYQTKRYEKEITVKDYLAQYVNVEEFLAYCKECKNYDRVWSCPSYDFEAGRPTGSSTKSCISSAIRFSSRRERQRRRACGSWQKSKRV